MRTTTTRWILAASIILGLGHVAAASAMCTPTPTTACLVGNTISVTVDWKEDSSGPGATFPVATDSTAFFTLDDPGTVEVMAKVLDACSLNGHYWLFMAILSPYELTVDVIDTQSGNSNSYNFPGGSVPQPISDTSAVSCDPPPSTEGSSPLAVESTNRRMPTELALVGGRFRVSVDWEDFGGAMGQGNPIPLTDSSGAFWFFSEANPERLLSLEVNDAGTAYRFVSSAPSSVGQTITVHDTCNNATAVHDLLPGVTLTIVDDDIHPVACTSHLFANDFESGNLDFWSLSVP